MQQILALKQLSSDRQMTDTDVAVIGISVSHRIPAKKIMMTSTKLRARYIDVTTIAETLAEEVCAALPEYHAFTGCDTQVPLYDVARQLVLDLIILRNIMTILGQEVTGSTCLFEAGEAAKEICTVTRE